MKQLVQLIDDLPYVLNNCYQHQLLSYLRRYTSHTVIPLANVEQVRSISDDAVLLSTIKIRNVYKYLERLSSVFADRKIFVYDQDPWESFIDTCTFPGGYARILDKINAEFIVTSGWWANYAKSKGIPAHFCRIWMLPEYCDVGLPSIRRIKGISFKGQLHGYRKTCVDELKKRSLEINVSKLVPYPEWMQWLRTRQAFIHDESDCWSVDGVQIAKQCVVNKDVEVASQGCFAFRDSKSREELVNYGVDKIPCIVTYDSFDDCVERFRWLQSLSSEETDEMIYDSVEKIRSINGWTDMDAILKL